jgi:hypothetical protein
MTSASKPTPIKRDRQAIYVGRRWGTKGTTLQKFLLLPERKEMYFKGVKGVHMGYTYECSEDSISAKPKMIVDAPRVDDPEWEAEDALVDAANAQKRADAKIRANASPTMKKAIESIKPLLRGRNSYERELLVRYLIEKSR